jgi:hypothetical protein
MQALFRYGKDGRTRSYGLKTVSDTALELWVESADRRGRKLRRLVAFDDEAHLEPFLAEVRKELEAGGWSAL